MSVKDKEKLSADEWRKASRAAEAVALIYLQSTNQPAAIPHIHTSLLMEIIAQLAEMNERARKDERASNGGD